MNAIRNVLLAAGMAICIVPALCAAAEPAPSPQNQDVQKRLEEARQRLESATRDVAELSRQLGRNSALQSQMRDGGSAPRALLGISVDTGDENKGGARVSDVSPGGAAAEAGIKPGDVITNLGGRDLTREANPGRALVDMMRQVEPNLKLRVDVLREGRNQNFDVTPRPAPQAMMGQLLRVAPGMPGGSGVRTFQLQPAPGVPGERRVEIRKVLEGPDDGTRFRGLEFATLSEKLGSYFGVKSGVLVVRTGSNPAFKLEDGDVILSIDGREPTSAQHAARILRSYSDGEKFTLRVQRDRKARDIEVTMPGGGAQDMQH